MDPNMLIVLANIATLAAAAATAYAKIAGWF
jgi:hypothetical protein